MQIFKRLLPMIVILLFEVAVGIMLIINGELFTKIIFLVFGILMLIGGIYTLIRAFVVGRKQEGGVSGLSLVMAIILIAVGGFFTAASGSVLSVMSAVTLVFGIIMAFNGMLKLVEYAAFRKDGAANGFAIVGAIVTIILGIIIAFNPFGATEAMWIIIGILIIVSAVFDVISLIIFGRAMKEYEDQLIQK